MKKLLSIVILAVMLVGLFAVLATADSATLPFTDVPRREWYYTQVADAYEMGLMKGKTASSFDPLANISRAEVIMVLANIAKANTDFYDVWLYDFEDGDPDAWYANSVGWAYANGIVAGFDDGTIRATANITRAEIVKMVGKFVEVMLYDLSETNPDVAFTDDGKIASWYKAELYAVAKAGVIKGDNKGYFNPSRNATRAEAATIAVALTRAIEKGREDIGVTLVKADSATPLAILSPVKDPLTGEISGMWPTELSNRIAYEYDTTIQRNTYSPSADYPLQIIMSGSADPDMTAFQATIGANGYGLKMVRDGDRFKLLLAYTSEFTLAYATEHLLTACDANGKLTVPLDFEVRGTATVDSFYNTVTTLPTGLRDPYLFYDNGTYYLYTTGWKVYKNTSGSINGSWSQVKNAISTPGDCDGNKWSPEVYKYNGSYYMFTTYRSEKTGKNGCAIFKASSPAGPFKIITNGTITPAKWSAIDGTLYLDDKGTPWMIFSHEHTSTGTGSGDYYKVQLSADLTAAASSPTLVFHTKDAKWSNGVADGPFMYTTESGDLLLLWSSGNSEDSYTFGVARSTTGGLDGEWTHEEPIIIGKHWGGLDGGHGMIFTDVDGQMYAVVHAPNDWGGKGQKTTLIPVIERNDTIVWDLNLK